MEWTPHIGHKTMPSLTVEVAVALLSFDSFQCIYLELHRRLDMTLADLWPSILTQLSKILKIAFDSNIIQLFQYLIVTLTLR